MKSRTINISLPSDLLRFVRERTRGGGYASASEVVREGLRLLRRIEDGGRLGDHAFDRKKVRDALEGLRKLSATQVLGEGARVRDLIEEGRASVKRGSRPSPPPPSRR